MDPAQPTAEAMAAIHFRAEALARRTVDFHRVREAEHRSRERFGRRFTPFPWSQAVGAVLADEALEDEDSVVALIRELGRQGCSEVALAALDLVLARGSPAPTKAMFDAAILVCATEYQDQRCLDVFLRMRSLGLTPDLGTTNLVLSGLCVRGRLEAAVEVVGEMRAAAGIRPNTYTVLMILQACNYKRRGAYRQAIDAVQALEAGGRPANEEVIEALLQVCEAAMRASATFEGALAVFSALSELHLADSTRVYNGLLGAAGRAGRWREAQALYGQMREDEVPPSLETHTALIQACVVGRALDHALHIFEHLVAGRSAHEAVPASIATYNHLIHACHQAGMLEKALEIASWVQKTGVEFDDETYGELMATIDVAQLWDDKAMKQARQQHRVVVPRSLRPAPYDAMRVMYLDHLESLQQEELLALEKLGGLGSWAPKSLTRGSLPGLGGGGGGAGSAGRGSPSPPVAGSSVNSSARSLGGRSVAGHPGAVVVNGWLGGDGGDAGAAGYSGYVPYGGGGGGVPSGRAGGLSPSSASSALQPTGPHAYAASGAQGYGGGFAAALAGSAAAAAASAASSRSVSPLPAAMAAAHGGLPHGGGYTSAAVNGHHSYHQHHPQTASVAAAAAASRPQSRTSSVKQMMKQLSSRPPPVMVGGPPGGAAGGSSFRSPGGGAVPSPSSLSSPHAAPTGYHEPPTWAQIQTLDAATAGPGGTPFSAALAAAQSAAAAVGGGIGDGADADLIPLTLTLAVEPANLLYGVASSASIGGAASRTSLRSFTASHGTAAAAATAAVAAAAASGGGGAGGNGLRAMLSSVAANGLPPLGEATSPSQGLSPSPPTISPRAAATGGVASPAPPNRQRSRAAPGGGGAAASGQHNHLPPDGGAAAAATSAGSPLVAHGAEYVPTPLPALSSVSAPLSLPSAGGIPSRRFSLATVGK